MSHLTLPFGIQVTVEWETGSGIAVCVHFVSKANPVAVAATDLTNAAQDFDTWGIALRGVMSNTIIRAGVRATDWSVAEGNTALLIPSSTNNLGTNSSPVLPLNVAICATHVSGFTGRTRRGRNYIPGIGENVVSAGDLIGPSFASIITAAYTGLRTNLLSHGLVQVVASKQFNNVPRTALQGTAVALTTVGPTSDSQRRRLAGRGA